MLPIHENYSDYQPPRRFRKSVERLLASLPQGHLLGVESIVLTDSAKLGRGKTKRIRGRKYPEKACLGFYHPGTKSNGPWIELVADNMVRQMPEAFMRWQFLSDMIVADTLYHEVGHHLDGTIGSTSRAGEQAADAWAKRLRYAHFEKRYWFIAPIVKLILRIFRSRVDRAIKEGKRMARSGSDR